MLNLDTRRRIDSARDILVGKVPDPKAQVEQITTALIYKFMDDMDKESEELGGEASFFVGEYAKYGWSKLLDTRLGGIERLHLYMEALLKMPQNPNLPQLFRDILKDAFLPYRDPETLSLFLKEINGFSYDHSEKLGDAFEYLLSVLGSQGDAGQFRTPRHIIDFIVEVLDPKKTETVLDPACGTAGFLISGYKHILKQNSNASIGDKLTPDEKTKLMNHFMGYDISPDMVRLSLTNMYLHGFPNPNIFEYDSLTSEERWDETYDVIMANPPFMSPKGGIRPHKRFSIPANRSEVLFVDYIAEHLNTHGRAGVIVPEGIIFQSGGAYKALRKLLVEKYLYAVVSLPAGVFQPYSGVKTSILFVDKQLAKRADSILFVKVENDGYDLGAQRRPIDNNDLPQALAILKQYKQALHNGEDASPIMSKSEATMMAIISHKSLIAKNGDYNLSGERYKEIIVRLHEKWPMVDFQEICALEYGSALPERSRKRGDFPVVGSNGITGWHDEFLIEGPAIIVGRKGSAGEVVWIEKNCFPIDTTYYIKTVEGVIVDKRYLYYILKSMNLPELRGGGAVPGLNRNDVYATKKIPFPPLEVQQELVAELDSYRMVIDGARQVVENYKPFIKIEPSWEMVKLGKLFKNLETGVSVNSENRPKKIGEKGILKTSAVTYGIFNPQEHKAIVKSEISRAKVTPKQDNIIISRMNTPLLVGASAYIEKNWEDLYLPDRLWQTVRSREDFSMKFVFYIISSNDIRKIITGISGGTSGSMKNISKEAFLNIEIPLPSFDIQKEIVKKIEDEYALVNATKKLIVLFEQKIRNKIAELWGDEIEGEAEETEIKQHDLFSLT